MIANVSDENEPKMTSFHRDDDNDDDDGGGGYSPGVEDNYGELLLETPLNWVSTAQQQRLGLKFVYGDDGKFTPKFDQPEFNVVKQCLHKDRVCVCVGRGDEARFNSRIIQCVWW